MLFEFFYWFTMGSDRLPGVLPLHTDPERRILQESHKTSLAKQIEKWSQTSSTAMPCYCICYALRSIPRLMRHPQHIINMHSVESIVTVDIHWRWYHLLPRSLCCPRVVWRQWMIMYPNQIQILKRKGLMVQVEASWEVHCAIFSGKFITTSGLWQGKRQLVGVRYLLGVVVDTICSRSRSDLSLYHPPFIFDAWNAQS